MSVDIFKSYTTFFDVSSEKLESVINMIKEELQNLYYTKCELCGNEKSEIVFSVLEEVYYDNKGISLAYGKEIFTVLKTISHFLLRKLIRLILKDLI